MGTKDKERGGRGFANLAKYWRDGWLKADIVGVVCRHEFGSVRMLAERFDVPFIYSPSTAGVIMCREIIESMAVDFTALLGCDQKLFGHDPQTTFNIHPGPTERFGGKGMYRDNVHRAVLAAYRAGEIAASAVTMHFVTDKYGDGPVFWRETVPIYPNDNVETLAARVHEREILVQPLATNLVLTRKVSWDGHNPRSLRYAS